MINTISDSQAYSILKMRNCPYSLPTARSMTQARIDLESLKPFLEKWYIETKHIETDNHGSPVEDSGYRY